jgi:hypothetical protein
MGDLLKKDAKLRQRCKVVPWYCPKIYPKSAGQRGRGTAMENEAKGGRERKRRWREPSA